MEKIFSQLSATIIPRAPRIDFNLECSCSNSCEKVLETLFENDEKITFEESFLTFNLPIYPNNVSEETKNLYHELRSIYSTILVNRELSLENRLLHIGKVFENIHQA